MTREHGTSTRPGGFAPALVGRITIIRITAFGCHLTAPMGQAWECFNSSASDGVEAERSVALAAGQMT